MRRLNATIFDQMFNGTATLYSATQHATVLGSHDQIVFQVTTDNASGNIGPPTLTVAIEHSADGVHWIQKNQTSEITTATLSATGPTILVAPDAGLATPSLRFVRLRMDFAGVRAHVRIDVTLRDRARSENPISRALAGWLANVSPEVLTEFAELLTHIPKLSLAAWEELGARAVESQRLQFNDRFDHVFRHTSSDTSEELNPIGRAAARLVPHALQGLMHHLVRTTRRHHAEVIDADPTRILALPDWKVFQEEPADRPGADTGSESWQDVEAPPDVFVDLTPLGRQHAHRRHVSRAEVHWLLRRLTRRHVARVTHVLVWMLAPLDAESDASVRPTPETEPKPKAEPDRGRAGACDRVCEETCSPCERHKPAEPSPAKRDHEPPRTRDDTMV